MADKSTQEQFLDQPSPPIVTALPSSQMREATKLQLAPHDTDIKVQWLHPGRPFSKPLLISADLLKRRAKDVRKALSKLNDYVKTNDNLDPSRDAGWNKYSEAIVELQEAGRALRAALFPPEAQEHARKLRGLTACAPLNVYCSDKDMSLPLGFVYDGPICRPTQPPSLQNFSEFWLHRFEITMYVEGGGCSQLVLDSARFRALYAIHRTELSDAAEWLGHDLQKLKKLITIPVHIHHDWDAVGDAWKTIQNDSNIVFVMAHSDGDWIILSEEVGARMDAGTFRDLLQKPDSSMNTLLILNCCLSAQGAEGESLLSVIAREGFCGLIGTEAEILNTYALRYGTRLMWELCANGLTLGQAFNALQQDNTLFPLNLFYSCYASRDFRLEKPLTTLRQDEHQNAG